MTTKENKMTQSSFFFKPGDFGMSVGEARERLFQPSRFDGGLERNECPCCNQNVKLRTRRLNAGMAALLCWLVKTHEMTGDWVNVQAIAPRFALRNREVSRLAMWGLVEAQPNIDDPSKRMSGLWKPTDSGRAFAYGQKRVSTHVSVYNNEVFSRSDNLFTIIQALEGGSFDYTELMQERSITT